MRLVIVCVKDGVCQIQVMRHAYMMEGIKELDRFREHIISNEIYNETAEQRQWKIEDRENITG